MNLDPSRIQRVEGIRQAYSQQLAHAGGAHWEGCERSHVYCALAYLLREVERMTTEQLDAVPLNFWDSANQALFDQPPPKRSTHE